MNMKKIIKLISCIFLLGCRFSRYVEVLTREKKERKKTSNSEGYLMSCYSC